MKKQSMWIKLRRSKSAKGIIYFLILILMFNGLITDASAASKQVNLKFAKKSVTLMVGESYDAAKQLTRPVKVDVVLASNSAKVAAVSANGIVQAKGAGKATITASVAHKGYQGQASFTVTVVKPAVSNVKSTLFVDPAKLQADVQTALGMIYNKDEAKFTAVEREAFHQLQALERKSLILALRDIYADRKPEWVTAWVLNYAKKYAVNDMGHLLDIAQDSKGLQLGAMSEMLRVMDSEEAAVSLGREILNNANADSRYTAAYHLGRMNSNTAYKLLLSAMESEKEEKVYQNVLAAAMNSAGSDMNRIDQLFEVFKRTQDDGKRDVLILFLHGYDHLRGNYQAWKVLLQEKLQSSDSEAVAFAELIWSTVKDYAPYKD